MRSTTFDSFSRRYKKRLIIAVDIALLVLAVFISFSLRLGEIYIPTTPYIYAFLLAPVVAIPIFFFFGIYNIVTRYIGLHAIWSTTRAVSLYSLVWGVSCFLMAIQGFPRSIVLINWIVSLFLIIGLRVFMQWLYNYVQITANSSRDNILIYGAGTAGRHIARTLKSSNNASPVAYVDHDPSLHGQFIEGLRVLSPDNLAQIIASKNISEIVLAIPSAERAKRKKILEYLEPLPVQVRTVPDLAAIAQGKMNIDDVQDIDSNDLLNRDASSFDPAYLTQQFNEQVVMVTGAGGSIGSELCRQLCALKPKQIIFYEISEYNLYCIEKEISKLDIDYISFLGSVCDKSTLTYVCKKYKVSVIYHAAAYKHVPLVEKNIVPGINNNVIGTWVAAQAAIDAKVDTFVLISTDKAVRPTNIMGATKRLSELVLQSLNDVTQQNDDKDKAHSKKSTKFTMVRFGNVIDSSGSVIPLFREQIASNGPVTVTHKEVTRFFMTIPEAARLVIQAGVMSEGGDVFVLNMGEPVKILDLAKRMIRLSGSTYYLEGEPNRGIEIKITGLRPGEKLYEELLIGNNILPTPHPEILRAREDKIIWSELEPSLNILVKHINANDAVQCKAMLKSVVEGYKSDS